MEQEAAAYQGFSDYLRLLANNPWFGGNNTYILPMKSQTIEGKVKENPWGNWSDVDKGWYIGHEEIRALFYNLEGKCVKKTLRGPK